jgi:hypothetical protein
MTDPFAGVVGERLGGRLRVCHRLPHRLVDFGELGAEASAVAAQQTVQTESHPTPGR